MARKKACDSCRQKKIQCDRALPKCNWCLHQNLICAYDPDSSLSRTRLRYASARDLAKRVERVEFALAAVRQSFSPLNSSSPRTESIPRSASPDSRQATLTNPSSSDTSSAASNRVDAGQGFSTNDLYCAGYHMGSIVSPDGIAVFSAVGRRWIRQRTGEEPILRDTGDNDLALPREGLSAIVSSLTWSNSVQDLPDRKTLEYFLSLFLCSHFYMAFPMMDRVLFEETLDSAYSSPPIGSNSSPAVARACLFSFMAIMSLCQAEWDSVPPIDGDAFAAKACSLMPQTLLDISLTSIQTNFMLCLYFHVSGQTKQGMLFHAITCGMIFNMGGHSDPNIATAFMQDLNPDDEEHRTRRHLRRFFWIVYRMDKSMTIRTGQPPAIDDEYCDLRLSGAELEFAHPEADALHSATAAGGDASWRCNLRLLVIKSKVCKVLYSPTAIGTPDIELLKSIRELDAEVEQWRQSVPLPYRPVLQSKGQQVGLGDSKGIGLDRRWSLHYNMHINTVHLEYYHIVSAIHEASGRCRDWSAAYSENLEGISSSIAISAEASRSTLIHLDANIDSLVPEAFRMTVFFAMSAVLNLFRGVLLDPLEVQVERDIQLIASAALLVRKMRPRIVSAAVEWYIESVVVSVVELARLSRSAVAKAELECRERIGPTNLMVQPG